MILLQFAYNEYSRSYIYFEVLIQSCGTEKSDIPVFISPFRPNVVLSCHNNPTIHQAPLDQQRLMAIPLFYFFFCRLLYFSIISFVSMYFLCQKRLLHFSSTNSLTFCLLYYGVMHTFRWEVKQVIILTFCLTWC